MKGLYKILMLLTFFALLLSCNKNIIYKSEQIVEQQIIYEEDSNNNTSDIAVSKLLEDKINFDYFWIVSDGRYLEDNSVTTYDWVGRMTPCVFFKKFEIPSESVLYQMQLRNEKFNFYYQTENNEKLYQLDNIVSNDIYDIFFKNYYKQLSIDLNGIYYSNQKRVGEQLNMDFPLVGAWGELPNYTEYRLIDYTNCLYYLEIDRKIPFWAVRKGIYLLKQIEENVYETISSFPEGQLRLEVKSDDEIWIRPQFSVSDEEGLVDLLVLHRGFSTIKDMEESEDYEYFFGN